MRRYQVILEEPVWVELEECYRWIARDAPAAAAAFASQPHRGDRM